MRRVRSSPSAWGSSPVTWVDSTTCTSRSRSVRPVPPIGSASHPGTSVAAASRPLAALVLALILGACAGPAAQNRPPGITASFEDGRFRVEWGTAQTRSGQPLIAGYISNTRGGGLNHIPMQIQTLDARGQALDHANARAAR